MSKRVIIDPNKLKPADEHLRSMEAYLVSNFMPHINHAIQSLRMAGKFPRISPIPTSTRWRCTG